MGFNPCNRKLPSNKQEQITDILNKMDESQNPYSEGKLDTKIVQTIRFHLPKILRNHI
jgi:hypothetical protein